MKNFLLLFLCCLSFLSYSQDCDQYLKKSDSILRNDGWANSSKVLPYYKWYYTCLEENNLSEPRINNLKQYQSFTLSANKKGGFAKKQNGEIGLIDENFNYVKTLSYETYYAFIGNTAIVKSSKNSWRGYYFIDYKGDEVGEGFDFVFFKGNILETKKGWDRPFEGGYPNGSVEFNLIEKDTIKYIGNNFSDFDKNEDYFIANKTLYDFKGNIVNDLKSYQNFMIYQLVNGMIKLELKKKFGYIELNSLTQTIPLLFDRADDFSENLACVSNNRKWGFIDKQGKEVIPLVYDGAESFSEGLAIIKIKNKFGFIDKNGNIVIPAIFNNAESFKNSKAKVWKKDTPFYINKNGECIENCK